MNERTMRAEMLLGAAAMEKLNKSHVAVFGIGGVGSWCAEALARAGVGTLTLIDMDTVSQTNINRQLCARLLPRWVCPRPRLWPRAYATLTPISV